jgi:hypothetical protein
MTGGLGSVGYDLFQTATRVLRIDDLELLEYAQEESKQLAELDYEKCKSGWCLFLDSNDVSKLTFACR